MEKEELERICYNCERFFPAIREGPTEFGICLDDEEFDPFIEELLGNYNYACCQDLIDRRKFSGEREACCEFSEIKEFIEIDENTEFGSELISSLKSGRFSIEVLKELILEEQLRNIDFTTFPVDRYSRQLKSPRSEKRDAAISILAGLIAHGNEAAFQEVFTFFQGLPSPVTIEEVHFKRDILTCLERSSLRKSLTPFLLDELYKTPSNNTTRQWISDILRFLKYFSLEEAREPLEKMLSDRRFSYRFKQKIKDILEV